MCQEPQGRQAKVEESEELRDARATRGEPDMRFPFLRSSKLREEGYWPMPIIEKDSKGIN